MSSREPATPGVALAWAEEAHALVQAQPRQALALAERALEAARREADAKAEVAALYALAWAQNVLGDTRARATLRSGIRIGERNGDRRGVGLLRRHLALTLAMDGQMRAARREIEAAMALLSGLDRARSEVQRVAIHRAAHSADPEKHRQVCADAARALRVLRAEGDEIWETRLLYNRGVLHLDRGELDEAAADLERTLELRRRLGLEAGAVDAVVALASLALLRGDVVGCLRTLEEVRSTLPSGELHYGLARWRATAFAQARLLPEARAATEAYVELCARTGHRDEIATSLLDQAAIAIMSGDPASARRLAMRAARSFARNGKPVNAALADAVRLSADVLAGSVRRSRLRSGLEAAAVLETAGWRRDALRTRLVVARIALAVGSRTAARRQLELAQPLRRLGTAADRIELCHTEALLRLAEGDRAGSERLLARGLGLLEEYRAALGAVELRATASGMGVELSVQGLRIAIEGRKPAKILVWAERLRGSALRLPLLRPDPDPHLSAIQAELRRASVRIREAEKRGTPARGAPARVGELEAAIRARTRLLKGSGRVNATVARPHEAAAALGERVLVEYVECDGALGAVTLADGRLLFHELGVDSSAAELDWLRFGLGRIARGRNDAATRAAALGSVQAAAAELDRLLLEPLRSAVGEAPLVVVPTGALHALPWAALPSLRGRPVVVAPSLSVWLELARRSPSRRRKTAVIAGPRLRHSTAEVREIAGLLPGATVLQGKAATAKTALAALEGAALVHIACHGHFRADSALFSSLELADGALNVYELQGLRLAPELIVLSACDLATSSLHPGDELLGFTAALLGMGTRTIVASVVPVPDAAARRLMVAFHRGLRAGLKPASALADAQAGTAVAGFICLGSG